MGDELMQSYVDELRLGDAADGLGALLRIGQLQLTARQYARYVSAVLHASGAELVTGHVTELETVSGGFRLVVSVPDGERQVRAAQVVLATGSEPRRPPPEWDEAGALTYDWVYRLSDVERARLCRDRSVLVVGSGNSAMQTAALVTPLAEDVTILATRYHGLFPIETDDRFAWRSRSALTCELVAKSGMSCSEGDTSAGCLRFLVYRALDIVGGSAVLSYRAVDNTNPLGRWSTPPRCRHTVAEPTGTGWREVRDLSRTLVIWATGSVPVYPETPLIAGLPRTPDGYVESGDTGETAVPGLYLTGACTGRRAVNEMRTAAVPAQLDLVEGHRP